MDTGIQMGHLTGPIHASSFGLAEGDFDQPFQTVRSLSIFHYLSFICAPEILKGQPRTQPPKKHPKPPKPTEFPGGFPIIESIS